MRSWRPPFSVVSTGITLTTGFPLASSSAAFTFGCLPSLIRLRVVGNGNLNRPLSPPAIASRGDSQSGRGTVDRLSFEAAQNHALAANVDASTEHVISKDEHGITAALCVLPHEFTAAFQNIISVYPEAIIAAGNVETLLTRSSEIVDMLPLL